jgi:CheY-like chemotaxis protein
MNTVLYIEDNQSNIALVEAILSVWDDVELVTETSGEAGIRRAIDVLPAVLLLDLDLPDIQGDEVLRRAKADPRIAHVPTVILTADATNGRADDLLASGAFAYVTKPLDVDRFTAVFDDAIGTSR